MQPHHCSIDLCDNIPSTHQLLKYPCTRPSCANVVHNSCANALRQSLPGDQLRRIWADDAHRFCSLACATELSVSVIRHMQQQQQQQQEEQQASSSSTISASSPLMNVSTTAPPPPPPPPPPPTSLPPPPRRQDSDSIRDVCKDLVEGMRVRSASAPRAV